MIYEPSDDSFLIAEQLKKIAKGKSVLDIGSGSGILAKTAINAGASFVLAGDISEESVRFLKRNGINAIKSNLFSKIRKKFDIIVFNPPYLPEDKREDKESRSITTGGKRGDELILKFLRSAKKHLNEEGIVLLVLSSLTPRDRINRLLKKLNFSIKKLAEKSFFMEKIFVFKIKEEKHSLSQ